MATSERFGSERELLAERLVPKCPNDKSVVIPESTRLPDTVGNFAVAFMALCVTESLTGHVPYLILAPSVPRRTGAPVLTGQRLSEFLKTPDLQSGYLTCSNCAVVT